MLSRGRSNKYFGTDSYIPSLGGRPRLLKDEALWVVEFFSLGAISCETYVRIGGGIPKKTVQALTISTTVSSTIMIV